MSTIPDPSPIVRDGTLIVIQELGSQSEQSACDELTQSLAERLHQPVEWLSETDSPEGPADILQTLFDQGVRRLTILPCGLFAVPTNGPFARCLELASRQIPGLEILVAAPLTWMELSRWLHASALDAILEMKAKPESTGLLIVGDPSSNSMRNANLACLAQLIRDANLFVDVQHAFVELLRPTTEEAVVGLTGRRAESVMAVAWQIFSHESIARLDEELVRLGASKGVKIHRRELRLVHPALLNLLVANHLAAVSTDAFKMPDRNEATAARPQSDSTAVVDSVVPTDALKDLELRINAMLPPEYRGQYEAVRPTSMGTAGLKFDEQGKVAWDEIWTSFCDLALAGGPPHRGTLLEAVTAEEALADAVNYETVVEEIGRGIRMVTSLPIVKSKTPGWVGVRCQSEEMAVWLLRAIIVENVMVRREGDVIYLPAGPRFTIKREIKNVVTAVAKTVHYWTAHLTQRQASLGRENLPDFATDQNRG